MKQKMMISLIIGIFIIPMILTPVTTQINALKNDTIDVDDQPILVRIDTTKELPFLRNNMDVVNGEPGRYIDVLLSSKSLPYLIDQQVSYTILSTDLNAIAQSMVDSYPTFEEMEDQLHTIASMYPSITSLYSIGQSYEDREIWCLEISNNPGVDEQKPGVLFMGLHHSREWPTIPITLSLINELVESYGTNETITELVDNRQIWVIPCVNPDGYYYDHDQFAGVKWWRKNRHYFPDFNLYGVDLNRNYGGSSNGDPYSMWGSAGISHHPESDVYCGLEPFSEMEVSHMKQFFLNHSIDASISWHTYGELVLWPWGYSTGVQAPDYEYMGEIGNAIAEEITKMSGEGHYRPQQSAFLYPTTGDTTDWFYGYSHYVLGKPHFAYTIEACSSFHPDEFHLQQICDENIDGALLLLKEAENISKAPSRVLPPKITDISNTDDTYLSVSWDEKNPNAELQQLKVQHLANCSLILDQASDEQSFWEFTDFERTSTQVHSGNFSYRSHVENNKVSVMTSKYPLFVTENMSLSFYCYYQIQDNYDYAFLEISTNGRSYTVLDSFTGPNPKWTYKEYDLSGYQGSSIFIRFRYFTDSRITGSGFFVDDIHPVSTFESVSIIDQDIVSTPFSLPLNLENTSDFLRVRGYNDAYGWGDFGQLYQISEFTGNSAPSTPIISGETRGRTNTSYTYTLRSIDPDDDGIYYRIQWDDENQTDWFGSFSSGEQISVNHSWSKDGTYIIKVQAKDDNGAMSDWGQLAVQMPHKSSNPFLFRLHLFLQRIFSFPQLNN